LVWGGGFEGRAGGMEETPGGEVMMNDVREVWEVGYYADVRDRTGAGAAGV